MASHQRSSHTALAPCSSPAYCSQAASLPRRKKRKKKKKKKKKSDTSSRAKCDAEAAQESVAASRQEPEAEAEMGAARVATAAAQTKIEAEAEVARADVEATRAVQAAAATAQVEEARPLPRCTPCLGKSENKPLEKFCPGRPFEPSFSPRRGLLPDKKAKKFYSRLKVFDRSALLLTLLPLRG